jgi:hypothetical protein
MKKLILILLFAAGVSLNSSAQIQKGAMLIGGVVNFYHSNDVDDIVGNDQIIGTRNSKTNSFSIVPSFGIFVANSLELGVGAGYNFYKNENSTTDNSYYNLKETKDSKFIIAPYLSKYFKIAEKFYITGTFNMGVGFGRKQIVYNISNQEKTMDYNNFFLDFNITPGIRYFINKNWALSGNIGQIYYSSSKSIQDTDMEDNPKESKSDFGVSMALNTFNVGIQYYLHN